jgi:GT2 family glycosyltransferase
MQSSLAAGIDGAHRSALGKVGVVAIGRNEGGRLRRCLESVRAVSERVVYVDSGSGDDSVGIARSLAGAVVELDPGLPFTAARARNAGFQKLTETHPEVEYVFFVDGDCEVVDGWLEKAVDFLERHPTVAVVCGLRREKHPETSIYNMLCDFEWREVPIGDMKACGGDALARVNAIRQMHGFRADLICGEEPEMCVRLRQAGWHIWRLREEMTLHDASMHHFGQWWNRMVRSGYSFAQGAALHGAPPERHGVRESARIWIWAAFLPLAVVLAVLIAGWPGSCLLAIYPLQILRLGLRGRGARRARGAARGAWWQAAALVVSKFAEMRGQLKYWAGRLRGEPAHLIEYK